MKRFGLLLTLLLMPVVLAACSRLLQVTLFNNTSEAIELHAEIVNDTIASNQFAKFKFPGEGANRVFRLSSGTCEYLYDFPQEWGWYGLEMDFERGIQVQVEKDFGIDLLPVSYAGDAPASNDVILRHEGFPLRPVSKKCR